MSVSPPPGTPDLVTPTPTQAEVDALKAQAQMLGSPFTLSQLRPFYPQVGWNVILSRLDALLSSGFLRKRYKQSGSRGAGYDEYFVV